MKRIFGKKKSGSVLVAVLLILFMMAVIATALIKRSLVSVNISTETRKSNVEYQGADALVEQVLLAINKIETPSENNLAKIEEITIENVCKCATNGSACDDLSAIVVDNFCTKHEIEFYGIDGKIIESANYKTATLDTLARIKINSDDNSSVKRAIRADIPKRILTVPEEVVKSLSCSEDSSKCDTDNTRLGTNCGSKCYKIFFSYIEEDIDKLSGVNILIKNVPTASEGGTWATFKEIEVYDDDSDGYDGFGDYDKLACSKESTECYFYIGSETKDISDPPEALDGEKVNVSFRLVGNSSYQLDSLDHNILDSSGSEKEFNFSSASETP